jgi:tripartite-type tricarboxylate transporter receptor subunit TctC
MNLRRTLLQAVAGAAFAALLALPAAAQDAWPTKPVKIISPFPAGGTSDIMARMVADALGKELGQQFVVDNVGGAGGTIGTLRATKMAADGYTLMQTGVGQNAVAHGLDPKLGYDSMKDFIHVAQVHSGPNVLVVNAGTPFKTFTELVDYVRKNPGKLNYGFTHAASGHMAMELLKQRASECPKGVKECNGFFMVGIPYRGGGPMMQDLLGGQIPLMFINQDVALPHIKAGKLRALAVTSLQRNPLYPDVPTVAESGFANYQALSWSGLSALKGTPQPIVDKLEATLRKVMTSPEIKQRLESVGFVVPTPGAKPYADFVKSEIELWTKVIKTAGIKPE